MEDTSQAAQALFQQGEAALAANDLQGALEAFEEAVACDPAFAQAHANAGYACDCLGRLDAAESAYRRALELKPDEATVHRNLGVLLARQRRHEEAEACYAAALALEPDSSVLWSNLGALNLNLQREETAEACLRHAIALDSGNRKAAFNLAYLQLRRGQWEEGWALFEARDWYQGLNNQLPVPRWQGEPLQGKTILVADEAGLGDMIQFCRYIPWLNQRGALHITLACHPALHAVLRTVPGVDTVCSGDEALGMQHDYWMPLLSAPLLAATRPDTVPANLPYLSADPLRIAHWAHRLPAHNGPRVGLVWKGNPLFENDQDRSLPHLSSLAPLWQSPEVAFISLQQGAGEEEPEACQANQPLAHLGPDLKDFADTAAVVSQLDLVIAVDTAVAHLAGALGKRCWLLLPHYMTDWRWGCAGECTPWYPHTMRLFRQGPDADWQAVIRRVADALHTLNPST